MQQLEQLEPIMDTRNRPHCPRCRTRAFVEHGERGEVRWWCIACSRGGELRVAREVVV